MIDPAPSRTVKIDVAAALNVHALELWDRGAAARLASVLGFDLPPFGRKVKPNNVVAGPATLREGLHECALHQLAELFFGQINLEYFTKQLKVEPLEQC